MSRNSLAPPTPIAPGTMSAPRQQPIVLAAPGSQVYITWSWRTVRKVRPCQMEAVHGPMCNRFFLDDELIGTHTDLSMDVWMRHPVSAR